MLRKIIEINEDLCDRCEKCVSSCSEGAIQIINGKAKLVKEEYCDGFGDCLGECPTGALKVIERESIPFDEKATKENLFRQGGHEAVWKMEESEKRHNLTILNNVSENHHSGNHSGCPGSRSFSMDRQNEIPNEQVFLPSQLSNWPVQLNLVPTNAPYYQDADLLLAADCCSYSFNNFHDKFIKGRVVMIGCPSLDQMDVYFEKLTTILTQNDIKSLTIAYMEVPCCMGIVRLGFEAVKRSKKNIPIDVKKISIQGNII